MAEKFKVVISGMSGRFPECDDVNTFEEKLYRGDDFITVDNRKWTVGFKHERNVETLLRIAPHRVEKCFSIVEFLAGLGEKLIPDATGKFRNFDKYDQTVFRMNQVLSRSTDIVNRKILEPSFEAIVDAGEWPLPSGQLY